MRISKTGRIAINDYRIVRKHKSRGEDGLCFFLYNIHVNMYNVFDSLDEVLQNMDNKKLKTLGMLAVIGGNVIFGFSFLFSKVALELVEPSVLIAVRFTVAFIVLNLVVLFGKIIGKDKFSFSLKNKPKKQILLLALCQPVVYFIAENYGIKLTSSSFAGIIIALIPIAGIVLDAVIMHSHIGIMQIVCAGMSFIGVILTTIGAKNLESSTIGLALLLIAVVSGALFYVFSKNSSEYYSPLERTYVMFGIGSIVYIIVAIIQSFGHFDEVIKALSVGQFWVCIAYLAVVSSVMAFLLLNFGSNHVSVTRATLMANSTTVISILAGVVFLNEGFSLIQLLGAIIIILSVTVGNLKV